MKVICNKCKNKFNYEKSMGICPACGRYMRSPQKAALPKDTSVKPAYKQQKLTKVIKKNPIRVIITIILLLCMASYFLVVKYVTIPWKIEAAYEHQKQGQPQEIDGILDKPFSIDGVDYEIGALTKFEMEGIEEPEGWKYVQIPFMVYTDDLKYYQMDALSVYLYIDGYYVPPLSKYEFPEYDQEGSVGRLNLNSDTIYDTFTDTLNGKFVFLIPENIIDLKFYIYQTEMDSEDKIVIENLEYIYRFAVKEGE